MGNIDLFTGQKKKGRCRRKKMSPLDYEQSKMLGTANMRFMAGDLNESLAILKALIKQKPSASEPWMTVGAIYLELGDELKSHSALFMAAYLSPSAPELWKRIATQSM